MLPAALALAVVTAGDEVFTGQFAARRDGVARRGQWRAGTALIARGEFSLVIIGFVAVEAVEAVATPYVFILAIVGPVLARFARQRLTTADRSERRSAALDGIGNPLRRSLMASAMVISEPSMTLISPPAGRHARQARPPHLRPAAGAEHKRHMTAGRGHGGASSRRRRRGGRTGPRAAGDQLPTDVFPAQLAPAMRSSTASIIAGPATDLAPRTVPTP